MSAATALVDYNKVEFLQERFVSDERQFLGNTNFPSFNILSFDLYYQVISLSVDIFIVGRYQIRVGTGLSSHQVVKYPGHGRFIRNNTVVLCRVRLYSLSRTVSAERFSCLNTAQTSVAF